MAISLLKEAPDDLKINNLHYSFRTPPFLTFHIATAAEQRVVFYTINKVHNYLIQTFKEFLVKAMNAYNFVEVRDGRYTGNYKFNLVQFNQLTEQAKQKLQEAGIEIVELNNHKFSIYDIFYFVDAYNTPKEVYMGGRIWDRATLINNSSQWVNYPACSIYKVEKGFFKEEQTKNALYKICQRAYTKKEMFTERLVSTKMFVEYDEVPAFELDISSIVNQ
jgi:hypothetical protein